MSYEYALNVVKAAWVFKKTREHVYTAPYMTLAMAKAKWECEYISETVGKRLRVYGNVDLVPDYFPEFTTDDKVPERCVIGFTAYAGDTEIGRVYDIKIRRWIARLEMGRAVLDVFYSESDVLRALEEWFGKDYGFVFDNGERYIRALKEAREKKEREKHEQLV